MFKVTINSIKTLAKKKKKKKPESGVLKAKIMLYATCPAYLRIYKDNIQYLINVHVRQILKDARKKKKFYVCAYSTYSNFSALVQVSEF